MPDYSLGRAHGQIQIDYDGRGADKAARDLDGVAESSTAADKSLTKTQKTLRDTEKGMDSAGDSADGYRQRLRDLESADRDVEAAESRLRNTLLDSKATLDDVKDATDNASEARKRHARAADAARDANNALSDSMGIGQNAVRALASIIPSLHAKLGDLATVGGDAAEKSTGLAKSLSGVARAVAVLGPQGRVAAAGLEVVSKGIDGVTSSAGAIGGFVKNIAEFEVAFGKISGLTLAVPSLGGLAGLGGAASIQGLVDMAGAAKQLSGVLGLLPAVVAATEFSLGTLKIAFNGVDDALKDMMADDPKKFLEDIKDMAPAAAQALLQVAQFRDQFKLAGGAIQESFFTKIAADIAPLIQTWLPAITQAMSEISGIFGDAAHMLAGFLNQPAMMTAFQTFVTNVATGLKAMEPALLPLVNIFNQLVTAGSSFFGQIGESITRVLTSIAGLVDKAYNSGQLQAWIQDGINAFGHLIGIVTNVGSAFLNIMDIADKFGGGGLLAWLEKLAQQLNTWTQSAEGQKALTGFFSAVREATDAFLPLLGPLVNGLASIATAFTQLGTATAPGWQVFFDTFAQTMAQLAPQIVGMAPALANFIGSLGQGLQQLMAVIGPELPEIFKGLSDAFLQLLPQLQPLSRAFIELAEAVLPQLPGLFDAVTSVLGALEPNLPTLTSAVGLFVAALAGIIRIAGGVIGWLNSIGRAADDLVHKIPGAFHEVMDIITRFFASIPQMAEDAGKSLIDGIVRGIRNGLNFVGDAAKSVVDEISSWFPHSPAKQGPFSGSGYTDVRGQKMIADLASGMTAGQPAVEAAALSAATAASNGLSGAGATAGRGGPGGAPTPGGSNTTGSALLPDNIAGADTSILTAYLRHEFSDTRGLKGLAKNLGDILQVAQSGANLISQNLLQPLFQGLGMIPGANDKTWRKMTPQEFASQQQADQQKNAAKDQAKGPSWQDVLGPGASPGGATPSSGTALPGDTQLIAALQAKGFSAQLIRLIQGFSQVEGNNPAGNPTLGFTDAQLGGASDLQSHVDALAKQFRDRASVAGQFPEGGTDQQQAQWIANVVGQSGLSSDWQGNAQPQDYVQRVMSALPGAAPPAGQKGPTWDQVTGVPPAAPAASGEYGLPQGTDTGGYGTGNSKTFPEWVMALADQFGVKPSTYSGHQESDRHEAGYAPNPSHENRGIDWSAPNTPEGIAKMQRFAEFLAQNAQSMPGLEQIIWQNPTTGQKIGLGGAGNLDPGYYPQSTYDEHGNHVHTRQSAPLALPGGPTPISAQTPGVGNSATRGLNSGLVLPSGQQLGQLLDNTSKTASANDQLLQSYLQGNPALAQQITAAQAPGAGDEAVMGALGNITTTINTLKQQDAVGNKNTIAALQGQQTQIAQQQGFTQQQSALQTAQAVAGGAGAAITGAFQVAQSALDAMTATQDIADRLVYGIRNTDDINKIVDNVQKYITLAANIANEVGTILSSIGSLVGAGAGADPSGGASGAAAGLQAAGQVAQLIAGVLQGVNMAIDFGQQVYELTMGYVGRFMSVLTGLGGGTNLMGNVGFLLNKNTGQLQSYSMDNPGQKNTADVPSWMSSWYDYNGRGNPNPQVNQQLNVYAGPGQSPGQMMNETMWMVNTGGTTGALAPANF